MTKPVKRLLRRISPILYGRLKQRLNPYARLVRWVVRNQGLKVSSGPFCGMAYVAESRGSRLIPKLLGSYEAELHPVLEEIIGLEPRRVIDIGCAEGYYAVGLARCLPEAQVYAFDTQSAARQRCQELAQLNGVAERIAVMGACDSERLGKLLESGALIVSDCEGYELELFRPEVLPALTQVYLLIELHDPFVPHLTKNLLQRFQASHEISLIDTSQRRAENYPVLAALPASKQAAALDEDRTIDGRRYEQQWAYLKPKSAA